jgi:hypothetical protein
MNFATISLRKRLLHLAAAFALALSSSGAHANAESSANEPASDEFGWRAYRPLQNFKDGFGLMVDRQSQWTLLGGSLAVIAARQFDDEAQDYFNRKGRLGGSERIGNDFLGTGIPGVLLGSGFWIAGENLKDKKLVHLGQANLEALLVTTLITSAIKVGVGRERPDGSNTRSFPSGHTSSWTATAAVFSEFYGWKVGVPMYMLSAFTAASRMSENRHWLSDTVGGALVGVWVGRSFARAHLAQLEPSQNGLASRIRWMPVYEPGGGQIVGQLAW